MIPVETMRASGVMPRSFALVSLMITSAAARSFNGGQLPAVTRTSDRNAGLRAATPSIVTPRRGPSSLVTTVPSGRVTGVLSSAQKPQAIAFSARCCERTANSSISTHLVPLSCAGCRLSGPSRGRHQQRSRPPGVVPAVAVPDCAVSTVRFSVSAKNGLGVSGHESELPLTTCETVSTPTEMNTSPSPALIACSAMRVVCRLDPQHQALGSLLVRITDEPALMVQAPLSKTAVPDTSGS